MLDLVRGPAAYLLLLAGCLLVTLPLELVLRADVYRRWRLLLVPLGAVVIVFSSWDVWGIHRGTWDYDPEQISGIHLPFRMPLEELLFFVVVPLCGLLSHEGTGAVLRWRRTGTPPWRQRRERGDVGA